MNFTQFIPQLLSVGKDICFPAARQNKRKLIPSSNTRHSCIKNPKFACITVNITKKSHRLLSSFSSINNIVISLSTAALEIYYLTARMLHRYILQVRTHAVPATCRAKSAGGACRAGFLVYFIIPLAYYNKISGL